LWDLNKRNKLISLVAHSEVVNCVKMKENKVISASSDSNLIIWNLNIEQRIKADGSKDEKLKAKLVDFKVLLGHTSDIYSSFLLTFI
jgi:WD40 repeat protein